MYVLSKSKIIQVMLTDYLGQPVNKSYCHMLVFKYFESTKKKKYISHLNTEIPIKITF